MSRTEKFDWEQLDDLMTLDITTTMDMAADWKLTGVGGGAKQTQMFCTLCPLTSDCLHEPNPSLCHRFCHGREDGWCCYHHDILSGEVKDTWLQQVEELKESIALDLADIIANSKVKLIPDLRSPARNTNKLSIHFIPRISDEKDEFIELLTEEQILIGLPIGGELQDIREQLLQELEVEHRLNDHLRKLWHCNSLEACMIALLHKVPCILHCENRVGIKLLTMLLIMGFSNAQTGNIFGNTASIEKQISKYAETIMHIFNNNILGDEDGPAQWTIPMDEKKKLLEPSVWMITILERLFLISKL